MTNAEQLARSAVPNYPYILPTIPDSIALGMQSLITYNGLVLNDRTRPDQYKINNIDGLGGADVRDNRVPRPVDHGEIAYDAYWGGRTLTIDGAMLAGNAFELTRMERDLRAAFGSLVESPMKFNWWDVEDEFSDAVTSNAWWKAIVGVKPTVLGNGVATFASSSRAYYARREYTDQQNTVCIQPLKLNPSGECGILAKCDTDTVKIEGTIKIAAGKIESRIFTEVNGVSNSESSPSETLTQNTIWVRLTVTDDNITLDVFDSNPDDPAVTPNRIVNQINMTMQGVFGENLGYGQSGYSGILATTNEWAFVSFKAEAIWPGDFITNVRPIAAPAIKNTYQTGVNKFKRDFQLTLRASNPRFLNPYTLRVSRQNFIAPGPDRIFSIVNHGTWTALPITEFIGENVTNGRLMNLTTGEFIEFVGNYPRLGKSPNRFYVSPQGIIVDSTKRTIVNHMGENLFSYFSPESNFPLLVPGTNQFELTCDTGSAFTMIMKFQHSSI